MNREDTFLLFQYLLLLVMQQLKCSPEFLLLPCKLCLGLFLLSSCSSEVLYQLLHSLLVLGTEVFQ